MARVLVPSSWITYSAVAGRHGSLTVLTMELVCITVYTQKMLVLDVNVSIHTSYPA